MSFSKFLIGRCENWLNNEWNFDIWIVIIDSIYKFVDFSAIVAIFFTILNVCSLDLKVHVFNIL